MRNQTKINIIFINKIKNLNQNKKVFMNGQQRNLKKKDYTKFYSLAHMRSQLEHW